MTGEFPSPEELRKRSFEHEMKSTSPVLIRMACIKCEKIWDACFPYGIDTSLAECPMCGVMNKIPKENLTSESGEIREEK
jgi:hypothetical protein